MIASHARVIIITKEIPEESAIPGDVGTIIEEYRDTQGTITGYELKILSVDGQTLAVSVCPQMPYAKQRLRIGCVHDRPPTPTIDEIRAVRHRISEEFGHDPKTLCEHYMKLQERHRDRLVRPTDRPPKKGS